MHTYLNILREVMENGEDRPDRTGVGTRSVFGITERFDLSKGFPAVTTKKLAFRAVIGELLWFMNGETKLSELRYRTFGNANSDKKTIWDANQADYAKRVEKELYVNVGDDCGYIYGKLWNHDNQLSRAIDKIRNKPNDRRILVNTWIPYYVEDPYMVALPPCHYSFQFYVRRGEYLDLLWNQRSVDSFLGLPFNIASYAALVHIVAQMTGLKPGILTFNGGDVHIYHNHFDAVKEQLNRTPKPLPEFHSKHEHKSLYSLGGATADDYELICYHHHEPIKAPMAV